MFLDAKGFRLPDKVSRVAEIAMKRGSFEVPDFRTKAARDGTLRPSAWSTTNPSSPTGMSTTRLASRRSTRSPGSCSRGRPLADQAPGCKGEIAGFLFGFPDLSEALQRGKGRLTPLSILACSWNTAHPWLIVNGAGILPRFQRLGGNALLYSMLEKIASRSFLYVDAVQIAETTELMLADMKTRRAGLQGAPYLRARHRGQGLMLFWGAGLTLKKRGADRLILSPSPAFRVLFGIFFAAVLAALLWEPGTSSPRLAPIIFARNPGDRAPVQ